MVSSGVDFIINLTKGCKSICCLFSGEGLGLIMVKGNISWD